MLDSGFYNMDCMAGMKEFSDKFFDLAIVDPPYGEQVRRGGYTSGRVTRGVNAATNGRKYHGSLWQMKRPDEAYFRELERVSKNQIIWGGNYFADLLTPSSCWIAWDKENGTNNFADFELAYTSFKGGCRIFRFLWNGMLQGDMKNKENRIHPTQKPVALYSWLLGKFSEPGQKILDTHVGSASSLIACHRNRNPFWGFEIDPEYYKQAKERLDDELAQMTVFDFLGG